MPAVPISRTKRAKMRYVYTFSIWPDETWGFNRALFDVFRLLNTRLAMPFTPEEFEAFRSELSHDGFTLRAITRVPYREPEVVL
jgi:hypothetical protein